MAAEAGHSKTVLLNFLKDPEGYGTKKLSGGLQNNFTGTEPEEPINCPPIRWTTLEPNLGHYWCGLQPNNH